MAFVTDSGAYDRASIMREARRVHLMTRASGVTFRDALRFAWGRARDARAQRLGEIAAFKRVMAGGAAIIEIAPARARNGVWAHRVGQGAAIVQGRAESAPEPSWRIAFERQQG